MISHDLQSLIDRERTFCRGELKRYIQEDNKHLSSFFRGSLEALEKIDSSSTVEDVKELISYTSGRIDFWTKQRETINNYLWSLGQIIEYQLILSTHFGQD